MKNIRDGVWVTMITPFKDDSKIDYAGVEALVEWYINKGVDGIFAVCQSSEMFWLSFEERYELAKFIIDIVKGRIEVIVSGNIEEDVNVQVKEARIFAGLSPDAVVFVSNRLENADMRFIESVDKIIGAMPDDTALGIYECPYPSKRLLTDGECEYLAKTGRFAFMKDTSCDIETMRRRAEIASGTKLKLYNANAATLYETLKSGYNGYCGVMANFHPDLYVWLYKNQNDKKAEKTERYLNVMSVIECRGYPYCAKRYLSLFEGFGINTACRSDSGTATAALGHELKALYDISQEIRDYIEV